MSAYRETSCVTFAHQIDSRERNEDPAWPQMRDRDPDWGRRRPEQQIDEQALRGSLAHVHEVTEWVLCGPDRASMRFGYENGAKDRLVSLSGLLGRIRYKPKMALQPQFEQSWLEQVGTQIVLGTLGKAK